MELSLYNKFITETKKIKDKKLLETFYNNRNDSYAKQKIKLLRENVTQYWCSLCEDNKTKLLNLMDIDEVEITNIDNFLKYGWNVPAEEFVEKFYNDEFDYSDEDDELKLCNLRENFSNFWKDLDDREKVRYLELVCERYS